METDGAGNSLREYIWLGDMPVAIIDEVDTTTPVLYYVHADHLNRPILVTNSAGAAVWQATWKPFGEPLSITGSLTYDARFPGQWFQIENGLNWNWNRHYDPGTGRYVQPDPLGLAAMLADGPSVYGYGKQNPLVIFDLTGRQSDEDRRPFTPMASPFHYSPRIDQNPDTYHQFPYSFDPQIWMFGDFCGCGFPHGNTGTFYYQRCLPGALNGVRGVYELGFDMNFLFGEDVVVHRFFRPD